MFHSYQLKENCSQSVLWTGIKRKVFARLRATHQVTGDVLTTQVGRKGHICYSSCRWSHWFSFWQPGANAHDLQSSAQRGELKGDSGGNHHPCTFQVLASGINSRNPPRNEILVILIHYFPWYGYSNRFSLVFPAITVLTLQAVEPMWDSTNLWLWLSQVYNLELGK